MSTLIIQYSFIPTLLVAVYASILYKKLDRELKILSGFIMISALTEVVSRIYWINSQNNLPLLHLYVVVGFAFLSWFYASVLKGFISTRLIFIIAIIFTAFSITNSILFQSIYTFNSYALTVQSILVMIFSVSTFILLMNDIVKEKKDRLVKSINWINSGLFIYYTSSLLLNYFGNMITLFPKSPLVRYTWVIHAFFGVVMYTCFFIGLWKRPKT